ncbi:hypothetical protein BD770DRAFT_397227 [Pilaira anomala]|nr:hypothetical protein BD770DRAFT_397227 [Pilaira anomala]
MYYVDHTRPPFVDISLPEAITVPALALILFYAVILSIDFYLLCHERHFNKVISPTQLRIGMAIIQAILPLIFISSYPPINILFAAAPWLVLCYTASMPTEELTFKKWITALIQITVNQNSLQIDSRKVRYKGISKVALGIFKLVFMHVVTDPLLPAHNEDVLAYSWLHPMSLIYTLLFGIKAYCLLGAIDVVMGAEQTLFGWDMIDLFNSPILASSPRDFWR